MSRGDPPRFKAIGRAAVESLPQWRALDPDVRDAVDIVSRVLPFRTNRYVVDKLIDWRRVPDDPMFQLTFPQRGMLDEDDYTRLRALVRGGGDPRRFEAEVNRIRYELNPHPAGQKTHNVPTIDGREIPGVQHKYRQTVLFFPSQGQTCHAYCTYCFRWPQFVGLDDLKFAAREAGELAAYLRSDEAISDVLITGGDPLVMKTSVLAKYIEPLLAVESLSTIRIGTKAPAYWPQRFVTDPDADELLRLFQRVVAAGKHLAIMAHYSHPVELSTGVARTAVRRIRATGAVVRMQAPLIRHVNDSDRAWLDLWTAGVRLGAVPYYMFVERDTGARRYFELPLVRCWEIFRGAYQQLSGLGRTVRGPVMSCFPGKCHVLGVADVGRERVFCLEFLQTRDPALARRPFFARFDPTAAWYDELVPLGPADERFFIRPEAAAPPQVLLTVGTTV